MKRRVRYILLKWALIVSTILMLWAVGFFRLVALLTVLFITHVGKLLESFGNATTMGRAEYWDAYGIYWILFYCFLILFLTFVYFIPYRKVRPVLKVGNRKEGIVIWIKGVRRGLHYEYWDAVNYLKKKENRDTGWPDALTIPRGPDMKKGILIVYRPLWSLKQRFLFIPGDTKLESRFGTILIPNGYFVNRPTRDRQDIPVLAYVPKSTIGYNMFDVRTPVELSRSHLKHSRKMIQRAVASNPEINQMDFTTGSFPVLGAEDD
jgi:heme/copper-type cytochrome/quinol oxidase subunit 2